MARPFALLLNIEPKMIDVFERNLRRRTNVSSFNFDPRPDGSVNALAVFTTVEDRDAGLFVVKNLGRTRESRIIKLPEDLPEDIRRRD